MQDLAKELLEMFTATKMAKVFFTNSGSEANDTQVVLLPSAVIFYLFLTHFLINHYLTNQTKLFLEK